MCGIAGFFTADHHFSESEGAARLCDMTKTLSHRGPNAGGEWQDGHNGIYLGHRRLSILDLSQAGVQPMSSHCGRYIMVYNGEIYNADELVRALKAIKPEIAFHGHSDTEILLESFALLGIGKTLSMMKGMFAIALWDKREHTLHLIRDHLGKKPLYAGWVDGMIAFASELKALVKLAEKPLEIDDEAFEAYRYFGFVPAPRSIYRHIFKVRPGHFVTLHREDLKGRAPQLILEKMKRYWHLEKGRELISGHEAKEQLKAILLKAVGQRMVSDVPLGAFLSGGIDSSLVTALMQAQSGKPVKSYSIGFDNSTYDESHHAEKVAAHLKTDHTSYHVNAAECLDIIPDLPRIYDEPFADYSQIPTAILCRQARKDTVVALSGDGGDEGFCGYKRYFMLKKLLDKTRPVPAPLRHMMARGLALPSQGLYNALGFNGRRAHSIAGFLQEKTLDAAALRTLSIQPDLPCPTDLSLGPDEDMSDLERMMMIDTHLYLPDDILVKVDRASMFSSLEVRSPLLDKDVIEFAWRLRIEEKIFTGQGRGKRPLYELLCEYVPRELIDRPKQGFTPPIAMWLKNELKDWAQNLIDTPTPLYEGPEIKKLWDEFISGKADHHYALWGILMAQSWYLQR